MIQNKFIINKRVIEKIVGEYIAVIYLLDEDGNKKQTIKPNFETKMYILDKNQNYFLLRCKALFQNRKRNNHINEEFSHSFI